MRESNVQRLVWAAASALSSLFRAAVRVTLWRVNTGTAWVGAGKPIRNKDGSVTLAAARPITLGFGMVNGKPVVGASDLCGMTSIIVTPEMVGRPVAVFTAIETKESGGGRTSDDQRHFIDFVREAGGIAGVAHTPAVAQSIVADYCRDRGVS
ncbi:hypothetical protein [Bordetella phage vB_BbrM_PHB04]|uniref:VRR-NUC domain-containing protein n=1 Tax=Bordetella phage vB_BbrM_PHB04 TaxID=2029657 RepID=A0A291LAS4_9CAUD|nr:hypothetical protein HOS14_gp099 [Bordetella phage vB_BbrM_PHB04]ATI15717.1 hypothetical protein [Bordetella phage vB_BbrM_PHB04]